MGIKTVGNDLDNAWIAFDNVTLPRSALLSRYAEVSADGVYNLTTSLLVHKARVRESLFVSQGHLRRHSTAALLMNGSSIRPVCMSQDPLVPGGELASSKQGRRCVGV